MRLKVHPAKILKNPCNWYLALWSLYWLQGSFYQSGGMLSQSILLILLIITFRHFVLSFRWMHKPLFFKGFYLLLFMYTFYGLFLFVTDGPITHGLLRDVKSLVYIKGYYISLLPIFSCYYYTKKGYLNEVNFCGWIFIFCIVSLAEYYTFERNVLERIQKGDVEGITNNIGYVFLSLMPCMLIFRKKQLLGYLGICFCVFYILIAMKRGAMLVAAITIIIFIMHKLKSSSGWKKISVLFVMIVSFYWFYSYIDKIMMQNDFFVNRIELTMEGDSSGRDEKYSFLWSYYLNQTTFVEQLIGIGANGTIKVSTGYAHNDWLEILINQGLLGIIIFLFFCFCFYLSSRDRSFAKESRFAVFLCFVIIFVQTFFSAGLTNMNIFIDCILGYALADGFAQTKVRLNKLNNRKV